MDDQAGAGFRLADVADPIGKVFGASGNAAILTLVTFVTDKYQTVPFFYKIVHAPPR